MHAWPARCSKNAETDLKIKVQSTPGKAISGQSSEVATTQKTDSIIAVDYVVLEMLSRMNRKRLLRPLKQVMRLKAVLWIAQYLSH